MGDQSGNTDLSKYSGNCDEFTYPKPDVCTLAQDSGPCKALFTRYYFNTGSGKCESFTYGGCQGNENNFLTLQECEVACGNDVCQLPKETGPCRAAMSRYYYNSVSAKCEKFTYGGCQG